jgi:pimeloyl-ACP methyl ester carboxylesterase
VALGLDRPRSLVTQELDLTLADGRRLHAYDSGLPAASGFVVVWHHGTPNIGLPPAPLFPTSERLGIRWVSYDRPGYGGSDALPGRDIASAAGDVAAVVDALGIERFAVMGHSGGGPHAFACAALLPDRVSAAMVGASLAPYGADGLDWFAGMAPSAEAGLRAAAAGRDEKERYEASARDAEPGFIDADWAALGGAWSWFGTVVGPAMRDGPGPLIDDDLAYVAPWGFDPSAIAVPTLVLHGEQDRVVPAAHGEWLAARIPTAELWIPPGEGHISVLADAHAGLEWLAGQPAVRQ